MRMRSKGFSLLEVVIVLAIAAMLFTIATPSLLKSFQIGNENNVAGELAQIGVAEQTFASPSQYHGYVALSGLTGTLPTAATPISCSNSFLLNGAQIADPPGYHLTPTYTGSVTLTGTNCPPGFSSFTINADPINSLSGQRHFFMDQTGVVRFDDSCSVPLCATANSHPYSTAVSTNGGSGGNGGNGGNNGNSGGGIATGIQLYSWTPGQSYPAGSFILRPAGIISGVGGASGVYVHTTAASAITTSNPDGDPACDSVNWSYLGANSGCTSASVQCNRNVSGQITSFTIPPTPGFVVANGVSLNQSICGTYNTLILSNITPPPPSSETTVFEVADLANGQKFYCVNYGTASCEADPGNGNDNGAIIAITGDPLVLTVFFENQYTQNVLINSMQWELQAR